MLVRAVPYGPGGSQAPGLRAPGVPGRSTASERGAGPATLTPPLSLEGRGIKGEGEDAPMNYLGVIEWDGNGHYTGSIPGLDNCRVDGSSLEDAQIRLRTRLHEVLTRAHGKVEGWPMLVWMVRRKAAA